MQKAKLHFSKLRCFITSALLSFLPFAVARAQRATQVVRYSVTGVSQGQISGNNTPAPSAPAQGTPGFSSSRRDAASIANMARLLSGFSPASATGRSGETVVPVWQASYDVTNNETNKKLSISIDSPMPDGMQLNANIGAPPGADARGPVDVGTASSDVVTGIGMGTTGALPVDFSVASKAGASEEAGSRKVTFTLISGA